MLTTYSMKKADRNYLKFLEKKDKLFKEYYERELKSREILMEVLPKNFRWKRFITKLEIKMIKKELC